MLKYYHFVFALTILIIIAAITAAGFGFGTKQPYKPVPYKNMWKNESKSEYVVFTSTRDGNYEIYSMNPDGSEVSRLTNDPADDYNPSISPDGLKIAFTSNRDSHQDGNYEIYIMNFDGSNQVRMTNSAGNDGFPTWSPDGTRIAFTSSRDGAFSEIYVMNADGANQTNLTNNPTDDYGPAWSPDGSQIAFVSCRDDTTAPNPFDRFGKVYLMNADGTNPRPLVAAESRWPSWSPDGMKIAFMHFKESALPPELHTLDLLSQTETVLDTTIPFDGRIAWSPYGQEILFTSYSLIGFTAMEREHGQLYRMSATGSAPIQITFGASNGSADWKGTIAGLPNPIYETEITAIAEVSLAATLSETETPTDIPEIGLSETPTAEIGDTPTIAALSTSAETGLPTDIPEIGLSETLTAEILEIWTPSPSGTVILTITPEVPTPTSR
jgi:TolB protein